MNKETLEEVAERYEPKLNKWTIQEIFKDGAKWQQEQFKKESTAHYIDRHIVEAMVEVAKQKMYSEEEIINIIYKIYDEMGISISLEYVLKQFKNK